MLYYLSIALTVVSNVLYHVFLKVTPNSVNPIFSLIITYVMATVVTSIIYLFYPQKVPFLDNFRDLSWASYALGIAIVGLEVGFLLAYRAGWNISLAGLISSTTVSVLLIPVGLLLFKETLAGINVLGVVLCLIGLILINYKG
jgi:uncharacterized membrane protein